MLTNLVQSDAAMQGALGKPPSPVNGSPFSSAFAAVLGLTQSSAPGIATKPGKVPASGDLPANSPDRKKARNDEPALAAAVPLLIPQVIINAQPVALPGPEAVAPQSESSPKADATAQVSPPTFAPLSNTYRSQSANPLGSSADSGVTAAIQATLLRTGTATSVRRAPTGATSPGMANTDRPNTTLLSRPMTSSAPAVSAAARPGSSDPLDVAFAAAPADPAGYSIPLATPQPRSMTLDAPAARESSDAFEASFPAPETGPAGSISGVVPQTAPLPADAATLGAVTMSEPPIPAAPSSNQTDPKLQLSLLAFRPNRLDVSLPNVRMAAEGARVAADGKALPSPSTAQNRLTSSSPNVVSADAASDKIVPRHSADNLPSPIPKQESIPQSANPVWNPPALLAFQPVSGMQPAAEGQAIPPKTLGNGLSKNPPAPVPLAGYEPSAPGTAILADATTVSPASGSVAVIVSDPAKPQIPAGTTGDVAPNPLASVAAAPTEGNQSPASRAPEPARTPLPSEPPSAAVVQTARMIENIGQSEMHIGLRTQAFGSVEVHTALREAQLGLAVSSERGDLRSLLQSDVPALQNALQQHDLRFENIRFLQTGTGHSPNSSSNPDSQCHSSSAGAASLLPLESATEEKESGEIGAEATRLSVHA